MNKKFLLGGLLFSLLVVVFMYMAGVFTEKVSLESSKRAHMAVTMEERALETKTLVLTTEPTVREFPGVVVADQRATISARLTAAVVDVLVDVGTKVEQGDVLLRLESDDLDAKVTQSEQALSSAQAQLNAARSEYNRTKELLGKKLVPQSQFDQKESALKTAQANLEHARATISEAQTLLGFSVITAPFDGIVTRKPVHQGDTATPGNELLSMYNPESLIVEVNVSESLLPLLNIGKPLSLTLPTFDVDVVATVQEVTPAADTGSRSYLVRLAFDSEAVVYPGSYAKAMLEVGQQQVLKVPMAAVYQVGQLDYVRVIEHGEVTTRLIQLGENFRVRKGLQAGDVVVLNPTSL